MADLAETVKILREAGARATFHDNGQLASIEFDGGAPTSTVTGAVTGGPDAPKDAIKDVIMGDAPKLEMDADDLPEGAGVDDEPDDDTEGVPEGETPIGAGEDHIP
jgi:hypothetical protein